MGPTDSCRKQFPVFDSSTATISSGLALIRREKTILNDIGDRGKRRRKGERDACNFDARVMTLIDKAAW
jgi:hypothetical protein